RRRAQARRGALLGQGLTHLFSSGRGLCNARGLRVSGGGADQIRDPVTGQPGSAEQDRLSAHAPSRTTSAPCAPVPCQFRLSGRNLTKPRRVVARVEWHPGELYPRVGFVVTNMSRPAERVVAFYNKRGTCEQWIKEGKGAIKWTRLSCRTFAANAVAAPASCARLQSRQFPAHAGDAGADQGLVADDLEGQADQDRREGGEPRPLCYLPDGRGRHSTGRENGQIRPSSRRSGYLRCW